MKQVAIFNDTATHGHYGCVAVMTSLTRGLQEHGCKPVWFWPVAEDWRPHRERLANLLKVDAIVVNGEGSIHNSGNRARARYLSSLPNWVHKTLSVPIYLINCTLHNLDASALAGVAEYDLIFVRETGSHNYLLEQGIAARVVPDLSLTAPAPLPLETGRSGVLITDSVDKDMSRLLRAYARSDTFFESMEPTLPVSRRVARRLHRLMPRDAFPLKESTRASLAYLPFMQRLAAATIVITGRFHTATLCVLTSTPFLALPSNTPKIEHLLRDVFGNTSRLIAREDLISCPLSSVMESRGQWTKREIDQVASYRDQAVAATEDMFRQLRAHMGT